MNTRVFIFFPAAFSTTVFADELVDLVAKGQLSQAREKNSDGVDVNIPQADGTTALMYAAYLGNAEMAATLIDAGANPDASNAYGSSAILEAAISGVTDVLELLLENGADANWSNPEGETALMNVARTGHLKAAELLLTHGADVDAVEQWGGQTALLWSAAQNQPKMLALLIKHGADVNHQSIKRKWGRTILNESRVQNLTPMTRNGSHH